MLVTAVKIKKMIVKCWKHKDLKAKHQNHYYL